MSHTKEPWEVELTESIPDNLDKLIKSGNNWIGWAYKEEDAHRIVACVTACAGIPTEVLNEIGFSHVGSDKITSLNAKIEALESRLRDTTKWVEAFACQCDPDTGNAPCSRCYMVEENKKALSGKEI